MRQLTHASFPRSYPQRPVGHLISTAERALGALWTRAHVSLGEATLRAIFTRVLRDAKAVHPVLSCIEVTRSGFAVRDQAVVAAKTQDFQTAFPLLVLRLRTVLDQLTGGILSGEIKSAMDPFISTFGTNER